MPRTDTTFVDGQTVIDSGWLQGVNDSVYKDPRSAVIVSNIADFSMDQNTALQRVFFDSTNSGTFNTTAGCMAVTFEVVPNNYFTANPISHFAVVLRQNPDTINTYVQGQGVAIGKFYPGQAGDNPANPIALIETWANGLVPVGTRYLFPETALDADHVLADGTRYKFWIESYILANGNRAVRYACWKWLDDPLFCWELVKDTGHVMDTNTHFDQTHTALLFGYVFPSNLSAWSLNFYNTQVIWSAQSILETAAPIYISSGGTGDTTAVIAPGNIPKFENVDGSGMAGLELATNMRLILRKTAGTTDFAALAVDKDSTVNGAGGKSATGSNAIFTTTNAASGLTSEFNAVFTMNNAATYYSDGSGDYAIGPQCSAFYANGNKQSTAPTWGGRIKIVDSTNTANPVGATFGLAINGYAGGTDSNSVRSLFHLGINTNSGQSAMQWSRLFLVTGDATSTLKYGLDVFSSVKLEQALIAFSGTSGGSSSCLMRHSGTVYKGFDFASGTFSSNIVMDMAVGHKLHWTGYPTYGPITNGVVPGAWDCTVNVPTTDTTSLAAYVSSVIKWLGALTAELQQKGILS